MMKAQTIKKSMPVVTGLKFKIMAVIVLAISTGFVWMATDQAIASPVLRTMDLLWRIFVCRCFFQFDLLS